MADQIATIDEYIGSLPGDQVIMFGQPVPYDLIERLAALLAAQRAAGG